MGHSTRREFLQNVGRAALAAGAGFGTAGAMGLAPAWADGEDALTFGPLEPLVRLMQETAVERLLPLLVERLKEGTELRELVAAAALANARTFGGEDYIGFHTMMALSPAWRMSKELPAAEAPLAVFKVLYRNTARIQAFGGRAREVLKVVTPSAVPEGRIGGEVLREAVRRRDAEAAERTFAGLARGSAAEALNHLLYEVQDNTEVHRVVLPSRAWDLLDVVGAEHAHTLLRQSVRYCLRSESRAPNPRYDGVRTVLPKAFDRHRLEGRAPGARAADDAWVERMSETIFQGSGEQAADAAAAALAEGIAPDAVGEAISLAANQLVLRDPGRTVSEEQAGKPVGSTHGDSIGVHACDSANAWRRLARAADSRNTFACLILGAYQAAFDRTDRGGKFLEWQPLPVPAHRSKTSDPAALLREVESAIRENLQGRAAGAVHRYGELGHEPRAVFDILVRYAISEDGALHAEKYYQTVVEEFGTTRAAFRWRHAVALARVTASEHGRPAAGVAEARRLLKV